MAGGGGGRSSEETPTWAVAVVCFISIAIEHIIHLIGKWFKKKHKRALYEALEKIKSVGQAPISNICISESIGATWHPCSEGEEAKLSSDESDSEEEHRRKLLALSNSGGSFRRAPAGASSSTDACAAKRNVDRDQVKAAIKAQQDQQIDNALLAEGQFYSDLELTEKEIERMVMEASRAEYLADNRFKQQLGWKESSTFGAEPSSSGARSSESEIKVEGRSDTVRSSSSSMQTVLSMGFSNLQAIEAYSIFGDDVDSMVCYLLETGSRSRRKGKADE